MRRYAVRLGAAGIAAILFPACGGGGVSISDAAKGGRSTTTHGYDAGDGLGAPPQPVDTKFTGKGSAEYCRLARSYQDAQSKLNPANTSPDLRQLFQDAARDIKLAIAVAPAEIRNDVQVVADGFGALIAALGPVNYDFTRLTPDLIARFSSQEFRAATERVAAYARTVCGLAG